MMTKMHFTYEPLTLTKLLLQIHFEKNYDRNEKYEKSVRYAIFEFMRTLQDDELENILIEYITNDHIECITFESDRECERIAHYLMQTERYHDLVFGYQKRGYSGLGVADKTDKTFYPCDVAHHWETIDYLLHEKYTQYSKAFDEIMYGNQTEYNGITNTELDNFILSNFQLVGETKSIENHLEDR